MSSNWPVPILAAAAMVGVVHAFMIVFAVPRPTAWYLGAMIYAGLLAVLYSRRLLVDKVGMYFMFAVVTVVGAATVCPCTGAHFLVAPVAGLFALGMFHAIKSLVRSR